jgi:hypothetical protein
MASRFLEAFPEVSVPAGAKIQEESETKVGKTEVDEGC